jgi:hypothetical protein
LVIQDENDNIFLSSKSPEVRRGGAGNILKGYIKITYLQMISGIFFYDLYYLDVLAVVTYKSTDTLSMCIHISVHMHIFT